MCNVDLAHMACRSLAHRLRCRYAPDLFIAIVLLIFPCRRGSQLVVVTLSMETRIHLGIPNVMLTLLGMYTVVECRARNRGTDSRPGVVIGFVISYRASSGYDRYWQGRSSWSDIARTSRTFTRLIWMHIPLKIAPTTTDANGKSVEVDVSVARHVMAEKRVALELVEGLVIITIFCRICY